MKTLLRIVFSPAIALVWLATFSKVNWFKDKAEPYLVPDPLFLISLTTQPFSVSEKEAIKEWDRLVSNPSDCVNSYADWIPELEGEFYRLTETSEEFISDVENPLFMFGDVRVKRSFVLGGEGVASSLYNSNILKVIDVIDVTYEFMGRLLEAETRNHPEEVHKHLVENSEYPSECPTCSGDTDYPKSINSGICVSCGEELFHDTRLETYEFLRKKYRIAPMEE